MSRVAFLFPGQGSQAVGMGRAFARQSARAAEVFARSDDALSFGLTALVDSGPEAELALTENTQPAVLTASVACLEAAREAGLGEPAMVAGHSLGEYTALVSAGVLSLEDAVRSVRARGRFMQDAVPVGEGAMAAVLMLSPDQVIAACAEATAEAPSRIVVAANFNGPDQTVIAGHADRVTRAGELCKAKGARKVRPLAVSAPFHSPLMQPAKVRLAELLESIRFNDASMPVVTNVEARQEARGDVLRRLLIEQVTSPVRWTDVVDTLRDHGIDTFVELGPGTALSGMVRRQAPNARVLSIADPSGLQSALSTLAA